MLHRALALVPDGLPRLELWRSIAHAHALQYNGEAFWEAIHRAIELTDDPRLDAGLHAELAYETAQRSGMWRKRPDKDLVDGWIERVAGTDAETPARAKALIAHAWWNPGEGAESARQATLVAEKVGDPELRSQAWGACGIVAFARGEFDLGRAWAERRFEVVDELTDPDLRADVYAAPTPRMRLALVRGDLETVRRLVDEPEQTRGWYKGWLSLVTKIARLDVLAALNDEVRVEEEARQLLRPGKYPEPFALRALGIVRGDEALIAQADERFRALRLHWHADQTESLRRFHSLAAG